MDRSESDAPFSRSSASIAVRDDIHMAGQVAPLLGSERAGIVLSHAVGIPVHAVVASRDKAASAIVLEALSRARGPGHLRQPGDSLVGAPASRVLP